jgi:hypothetical protein
LGFIRSITVTDFFVEEAIEKAAPGNGSGFSGYGSCG